jgi:GNAT superfamily N-acetyltransferase
MPGLLGGDDDEDWRAPLSPVRTPGDNGSLIVPGQDQYGEPGAGLARRFSNYAGAGLADLYRGVSDYIARQQQDALDKGLWTGGQAWEGGHQTAAGSADQAMQMASLLGSIKSIPRLSGIRLSPDGTILSGGGSVGKVKFEHGDQASRIADIQIDPSMRNQGIGSEVIRQIQDEAAARGNPVVLSTDAFRGRQAQIDQRRLYDRLGFVPNTGSGAVSERIGGKRVAEELVWRPFDGGEEQQ